MNRNVMSRKLTVIESVIYAYAQISLEEQYHTKNIQSKLQ